MKIGMIGAIAIVDMTMAKVPNFPPYDYCKEGEPCGWSYDGGCCARMTITNSPFERHITWGGVGAWEDQYWCVRRENVDFMESQGSGTEGNQEEMIRYLYDNAEDDHWRLLFHGGEYVERGLESYSTWLY